MRPLIGIKVTDLFYNGPGKVDSKVLEIKSNDSSIKIRKKKLDEIKEKIKNKNVSMHTQTKRAFTDSKNKIFQEIEIQIIQNEILLCRYLGIKELILHLKQEKLNKKEKKFFKEILVFAKKNNVEIIYESNGKFKAKTTLDVLKSFPKINYNLDIGHLNTAIENKTLGMPWEDFIDKVSSRIVYLHIHNNSGEDDHLGLEEGTLNWRDVLDKLNFNKVRKIIIEVHDYSKMKKEIKLIENYLKLKGIK
jgi:sugar phosphate isomerase/epimerase